MHMLNDSALNVAIISLSMYKIKAFIKKKKKLFQTLVLILFMIENMPF